MIPLLLAAALLTAPTPGASITLTSVDPVERQMTAAGQSRQIVGVFSTRYAIRGQQVSPFEFWKSIHIGSVLDVKTKPYNAFQVLIAASVNLR